MTPCIFVHMFVATYTNFNMIIFHTVEKVGEGSVKCNSFYLNFHQHPPPLIVFAYFQPHFPDHPLGPPPHINVLLLCLLNMYDETLMDAIVQKVGPPKQHILNKKYWSGSSVCFWPPGSASGSVSHKYRSGYGSGSGSFHHQAKLVRKP